MASLSLSLQDMSKQRMMDIRKSNCNPMTMKVTYYKSPVFIHQGHMQWLWDVDGKRYLDLFAGVATVSVGHCHPYGRSLFTTLLQIHILRSYYSWLYVGFIF